MKNRIAAVAGILLALTATSVMAQQGPPPGGMGGMGGMGQGGAGRRMQMLLQGITLAPAQQAKFDSINTRYQAQMPPFTPGTPPDSATRARRTQLSQARDGELRAVLTPDQQAIWDRNVAAMPQRPMGPPRP
jgi:Spy/CpxP family protein refolding chaperone